MSAPAVALVLSSGLALHGFLVRRGLLHLRLVLEDGSRAVVRRSAVLAIVYAPADKAETEERK